MAGRVQRADPQRSDLDGVAAAHGRDLRLQLRREPGNVRRMRMDANPAGGEERCKAIHVIEMVMAHERVRHLASVLLGGAQGRLHVPGGIDDRRLHGVIGAEQVDEIFHGAELQLTHVHDAFTSTRRGAPQG